MGLPRRPARDRRCRYVAGPGPRCAGPPRHHRSLGRPAAADLAAAGHGPAGGGFGHGLDLPAGVRVAAALGVEEDLPHARHSARHHNRGGAHRDLRFCGRRQPCPPDLAQRQRPPDRGGADRRGGDRRHVCDHGARAFARRPRAWHAGPQHLASGTRGLAAPLPGERRPDRDLRLRHHAASGHAPGTHGASGRLAGGDPGTHAQPLPDERHARRSGRRATSADRSHGLRWHPVCHDPRPHQCSERACCAGLAGSRRPRPAGPGIRSERNLTFAEELPDNNVVVEGEWWLRDDQGGWGNRRCRWRSTMRVRSACRWAIP